MEKMIKYYSLDEAREEIKKRWNDKELKVKIEKELGALFIPDFSEKPRSISFRQIITPDNGFMSFYCNSKYIGVEPLVMEYKKDIFVSFNEEKKALGKLRVVVDGKRGYLNILDFHGNEKKPLGEVNILNGQKLIDFHHDLMNEFGYSDVYRDFSDWFTNIGHASEYYLPLLLHCVAHGVLFETLDGDEHEKTFTNTVMIPTMNLIEEKFGYRPIVVQLYPDEQTPEEGFYWFSYPPFVNNKICDNFKSSKLIGKMNMTDVLKKYY